MNQERLEHIRENNADTITWILGTKGRSKYMIKSYILDYGTKDFLLHHKSLELANEEHERIGVLKRIIKALDGEIETINFGDLDGGANL
ncbi:hypothetical protein [Fusibacter ferrireducens]|uniref:Uncharacterized protein n=1 Tax=Fusibacter ferrireducens TaxID=2785058 RepID=A0ABR9ZPC2_9FIRM|nr:hypothetical protein [Fusibacter ferrireducens]MBF4692317.1 hypothetical protein [Fusibacter ferrireducens]